MKTPIVKLLGLKESQASGLSAAVKSLTPGDMVSLAKCDSAAKRNFANLKVSDIKALTDVIYEAKGMNSPVLAAGGGGG
jgi:hypothetical protein